MADHEDGGRGGDGDAATARGTVPSPNPTEFEEAAAASSSRTVEEEAPNPVEGHSPEDSCEEGGAFNLEGMAAELEWSSLLSAAALTNVPDWRSILSPAATTILSRRQAESEVHQAMGDPTLAEAGGPAETGGPAAGPAAMGVPAATFPASDLAVDPENAMSIAVSIGASMASEIDVAPSPMAKTRKRGRKPTTSVLEFHLNSLKELALQFEVMPLVRHCRERFKTNKKLFDSGNK